MSLHFLPRWHTLSQSGMSQCKAAMVAVPLRIFTPQASHGFPVAMVAGPGFRSTSPALNSRSPASSVLRAAELEICARTSKKDSLRSGTHRGTVGSLGVDTLVEGEFVSGMPESAAHRHSVYSNRVRRFLPLCCMCNPAQYVQST